MSDNPNLEELRAVAELLRAGRDLGYSVTFTPLEDDAWETGYMRGMGGGTLSAGPDLVTACRAGLLGLQRLAAEPPR